MDEMKIHSGAVTLEELAVRLGRLEREFAAFRDGAGPEADQLLDSATVSQYLSISYRQLKKYKQRGEITPVYCGTKCLYPASEVRRFIHEVLKVKGRKTKTDIINKEKNYGKTGK